MQSLWVPGGLALTRLRHTWGAENIAPAAENTARFLVKKKACARSSAARTVSGMMANLTSEVQLPPNSVRSLFIYPFATENGSFTLSVKLVILRRRLNHYC